MMFLYIGGIDVLELWVPEGPKTDGYASPDDMAAEKFEEMLKPLLQEL
ncbi:MAG: hypothetical protein MRJ65_12260 [Candidatus Brocadiaceae bacterium]|nr:hypothetical protein [Candidatus Brocadiaceae bacterium]